MRKPIKCLSISYDKVPVFAGQVLRGNLNFSLRDQTHVKSIILTFEGSSKTSSGKDAMTKDGREQWFFKIEVPCLTYLFQATINGGGKYRLEPGEHQIPFALPIPPHVPSAFGGKYGYVYYCCKAVIVTTATLGTSEFRAEQPIPLIGIEDLNWHPHTKLPVTLQGTYQKRRMCVKQTDVELVIRLPKSGFLPGEEILLNGEIENKHRARRVKRVSIELLQSVYFQVDKEKERCTRNVLAQITRVDLEPGSIEMLEDEPIKIPGCVCSFLRNAEHITTHYDLIVSVDASIRLRTPIIIGTIPFKQHQKQAPIPIMWDNGKENVLPRRVMPPPPFMRPQPAQMMARMPPPYAHHMRQKTYQSTPYEDEDDKHVLTIEEIE